MNKQREELADELFEVYNNVKTESVYDNHNRWLAVADYVIKDRKRICEPLIKAVRISDEIGRNELASVAWQRLDRAVFQTMQLAGLGDGQ